ncbi:PREDICTED: uncharacterized protein LOC109177740 [Ipomoea nil]|uniref:uncharacterized protein LOC109177740 n=1 Tax=Ipomoea nil TaxID=35883 RepID=UPI0009015C28|nr:PREDICTED: uncharacterized protein LOC109177740 [Ipomoea nil]XP_019182723.1 PREDICTED: uncharacterized protein LOC109177740 [Ipomoea nil]
MGEDKLDQPGGDETIIPTTNRRIGGEGGENDAVNLVKDGGVEGSASSSSSSSDAPSLQSPSSKNKGKSCKGCLYYSSTLKSKSRNPLCVGITRSFPQVPRYIVGESEAEASKEGRSLTDFRYACIGYSVYSDQNSHPTDGQETQTELPACVGLEILLDKRTVPASHVPNPPVHAHNREDGLGTPQPRPYKPAHSSGDEFLSRFSRNANLVAMGVVKNLRKVGNRIKESIDDILYRRPK